MYWLQENAEAMFAVRATLLCDRWEETLTQVRHSMARDRRLGWRWNAPNTSSDMNATLVDLSTETAETAVGCENCPAVQRLERALEELRGDFRREVE
jgi:hypothetical protein